MPSKPLTTGDNQFASLDEAERFFRGILGRWEDEVRIEGDDDVSLRALFILHPEASQKLEGYAIAYFIAGPAPQKYQKSRCFYVVRMDGKRVKFSFQKAIGIR
jgi:hypothetical protein